MVERPTGTVTFLFTDIEGSTRRWEENRTVMSHALDRHDEVLRSAIESHGGWLFKHTGDGVVAAFSSPSGAVQAAIDAQKALDLSVRMGLATGEAELRGDDYFGPTLNRAARVMAAGHGGQVLVASSTAALLSAVDLLDLGAHRLRDVPGNQRLYQVCAEGLRRTFPPLRTLDVVPGNLPSATSSFIGREAELAELTAAVGEHRLVTLTGVGGVGKTRLALRVAEALSDGFPEGAWLIELAPVGDPEAVPDAVAAALRITPQAGLSVVESIAEGLAGRRVLLILDNCEHVLDAAAGLVEVVLARSGEPRVIATSREGLRLPAEHLWPVPSLDVRAGPDSEAVSLFLERAKAVVPSFALDGEAEAVAEICRRLDGIPLAIEMAAARIVSMSAADVRDLLDDRFRLLAGGRRGLERHQTLRHAIQWSYDLLSEDERRLLNACSVFAGGFTLRAATEVCGGEGVDRFALIDLLDWLVRKSLLGVDRLEAGVRYTMLETIRQFAEEQLSAVNLGPELRDRHARHFAAECRRIRELFDGSERRKAAQLTLDETGNLRSAFRWALGTGDVTAAGLIASVATYVGAPAMWMEPIGWAEEILPLAEASADSQLLWLHVAATFCCDVGRIEDGRRYGEAGLSLIGDPQYEAVYAGADYFVLSHPYLVGGQLDRYVALNAEGVARTGDPYGLCRAAIVWGLATLGRFEDAVALAGEAVEVAERGGNPAALCYALMAYGKVHEANPPVALAAVRRSSRLARENLLPLWEALAMRDMAILEATNGDPGDVLAPLGGCLESFSRTELRTHEGPALGCVVVLFNRLEEYEPAAIIYGSCRDDATAKALVPQLGPAAEHLRSVLGDDRFERLAEEGAGMLRGDAVRFAQARIAEVRGRLEAGR